MWGGGTELCYNCLLPRYDIARGRKMVAGGGEAGGRVKGKREGESRGSVRESRGEA